MYTGICVFGLGMAMILTSISGFSNFQTALLVTLQLGFAGLLLKEPRS